MDAAAPSAPDANVNPTSQRGPRLPGVDRLRGLVIVIMALDHVRDFFDADAVRFFPTDLTHTYVALFLTRFVTHYCAPTFALLAGVSAYLHGQRLGDRAALAKFLLTRGMWLVLLDAIVISPIWTLHWGEIELGALWAIGGGMVALSVLVFLPSRFVLGLGAFILVTHNLVDGVHAAAFGAYGGFWSLLHEPGALPLGVKGKVLYPLLPWIGIVACGYGLGPLFSASAEQRAKILTRLGLAALALFVVLRSANLYGDPHPWSVQADATMTPLAFLNVTKYPPSLLYALVTLGPALLLLPRLERLDGRIGRVLSAFGETSLFFYVLHLYLGLGAALALERARGFGFDEMSAFIAKGAPPQNFGVGVAGAYVAWIALVATLYPLCSWFAGVKRRHRSAWLSYL